MNAIQLRPGSAPPLSAFDPLRFCIPAVEPERRRAMVAEAAYFRAAARGFAPGHELEDWLAAEADVDRRLLNAGGDAVSRPGGA